MERNSKSRWKRLKPRRPKQRKQLLKDSQLRRRIRLVSQLLRPKKMPRLTKKSPMAMSKLSKTKRLKLMKLRPTSKSLLSPKMKRASP